MVTSRPKRANILLVLQTHGGYVPGFAKNRYMQHAGTDTITVVQQGAQHLILVRRLLLALEDFEQVLGKYS